jgi:hypothetical protein
MSASTKWGFYSHAYTQVFPRLCSGENKIKKYRLVLFNINKPLEANKPGIGDIGVGGQKFSIYVLMGCSILRELLLWEICPSW